MQLETWIKWHQFIHGPRLFLLDLIHHKNCGLVVQICNELKIFWNYGLITKPKPDSFCRLARGNLQWLGILDLLMYYAANPFGEVGKSQ